MTQGFVLACMVRRQPRFFTGDYDFSARAFAPTTTGRINAARVYDSRDIADVLAVVFNTLDRKRRWMPIEIPEARRS